jgi:hypothetical protein
MSRAGPTVSLVTCLRTEWKLAMLPLTHNLLPPLALAPALALALALALTCLRREWKLAMLGRVRTRSEWERVRVMASLESYAPRAENEGPKGRVGSGADEDSPCLTSGRSSACSAAASAVALALALPLSLASLSSSAC